MSAIDWIALVILIPVYVLTWRYVHYEYGGILLFIQTVIDAIALIVQDVEYVQHGHDCAEKPKRGIVGDDGELWIESEYYECYSDQWGSYL